MSSRAGMSRRADVSAVDMSRTGAIGGASERGAALVIALLLLIVFSLLAITGMRTAIAELWMAGSEQFHRVAVEAASAGVEASIARLRASSGVITGDATIEVGAGAGSGARAASYAATTRRVGTEASIPGSSAEKFVGEHFEIKSTGTAPRSARDVQVQGVMVISSSNGVRTFRSIGEGLGAEPSP